MTQEYSDNCPWCGCESKTVGHGLATPSPKGKVDWQCGSFLHGVEPRQSTNCELNVETAKGERLEAFVLRVYEFCDEHIEARKDCSKRACSDCPVWNLRVEAAKLVEVEAEAGKTRIVTAPAELIEAGQRVTRKAAAEARPWHTQNVVNVNN